MKGESMKGKFEAGVSPHKLYTATHVPPSNFKPIGDGNISNKSQNGFKSGHKNLHQCSGMMK